MATRKNTNSKAKIRLNPAIKLEKHLSKQIYEALQGSVVEAVLRKIKTSSSDAYWRSSMEGHSLKVQKDLLPDFYALCQEVKEKLHFDAPVDFYITGDSSVNAFSVGLKRPEGIDTSRYDFYGVRHLDTMLGVRYYF